MRWWRSQRGMLLPEHLVVTGERHHAEGIRAVLRESADGQLEYRCKASLHREPHNAADPTAVAVMVDGHRVGYIARAHSASVTKVLSNTTADVKCVINWNGEATNGIYRVKLFASF